MGNKTNSQFERESRTIRAKGGKDCVQEPTSISNIPQVFTVWRERDLAERIPDTSTDLHTEQEHEAPEEDDGQQEMDHSTYGVHSLAETIAFESGDEGNDGDHMPTPATDSAVSSTPSSSNVAIGKRRRPGNPVHPKILATGQRIISSEHSPAPKTRPQQTRTSTAIPSLKERMRTMSIDSTHLASSQASSLILTPDIPPGSAVRAGSPRSLRLSDDESLTFDDSASQAVFSSSGEEDEDLENQLELGTDVPVGSAGPQFVMPSLPLPTRRPFTERGSQIGSFRILVAGRKDVGKSSLIQGLLDTCPDIVHHQGARVVPVDTEEQEGSSVVVETAASTKAMPKWKTVGLEESTPRALKGARSGTLLLERNISILECDAEEASAETAFGANVLSLVEGHCKSALAVEQMDAGRLAALLTGESRHVIDVALYVVKGKDHTRPKDRTLLTALLDETSTAEAQLIDRLSRLTNVALVSRSDGCGSLQSNLQTLLAQCIRLSDMEGLVEANNGAVNLAHLLEHGGKGSTEDSNTSAFVDALFNPATIKQLRHLAARKLVKWHKTAVHTSKSALPTDASQMLSTASTARVPQEHRAGTPFMEASMTCSTISSPSGVLVPYPDSSFYHHHRPDSPTSSAHTIDSTSRIPSGLELATLQHRDRQQSPVREIRLAQWALDLQRSLQAEHNRQHRRFVSAAASARPPASDGGTMARIDAVTPSSSRRRSPAKVTAGTLLRSSALHGPDAADPLGIVRLGSRLRRDGLPLALRVAGVGAVVATVLVAAVRSWDTVKGWWMLTGTTPSSAAATGTGGGDYYIGTGGEGGLLELWEGIVGQAKEWLTGF